MSEPETRAPRLGALITEEGACIVQLDRQLPTVEAVLNNRTHDTGGAFRAQGD